MAVARCPDWQVDYIISLIDDDKNSKIDSTEFVTNYYIINRELKKNDSKNKKTKKSADLMVDINPIESQE